MLHDGRASGPSWSLYGGRKQTSWSPQSIQIKILGYCQVLTDAVYMSSDHGAHNSPSPQNLVVCVYSAVDALIFKASHIGGQGQTMVTAEMICDLLTIVRTDVNQFDVTTTPSEIRFLVGADLTQQGDTMFPHKTSAGSCYCKAH